MSEKLLKCKPYKSNFKLCSVNFDPDPGFFVLGVGEGAGGVKVWKLRG